MPSLDLIQNASQHNGPMISEPIIQGSLFGVLEKNTIVYTPIKDNNNYQTIFENLVNHFSIQNRRFLGNKNRLLNFIENIVNKKCENFKSFCDIFAGTGVVGAKFNNENIKVISNDILNSNFVAISAFIGSKNIDIEKLKNKINYLNCIKAESDNYFSLNYGGTFFTIENARKIGAIRSEIENIAENQEEKNALITSLIYATDKVANTVGHYDAFRKKLDSIKSIKLLIPTIEFKNNRNNEIYKEDANVLIRKIECDVLYIDPPYNSRQYCDAYHLLENLVNWEKPKVFGKAKKMDRSNLKSNYCLKSAPQAFEDLIQNAKCKHILISYNNTGESKDGRSNARISDAQMMDILKRKGDVEIFERDYRAFSTGKSNTDGNSERIFYCKVKN